MKPFLVDVPVLICSSTARNSCRKCLNKSGMPVPPSFPLSGRTTQRTRPARYKACREVTDQIDWDCEVHRMYQEKTTVATLRNTFHKMGFSMVDKCIVLEDDDVPSVSFSHSVKKC